MKKLAIITSHPIQYNAPLFKELAERKNIEIKVFYTWSQSKDGFFDKGFNKIIEWDIPLLAGYNYEFITNTSRKPSSQRYRGIICPELISKIKKWNPEAILFYGWAFHAHFNAMRYFKGKIPILFKGDSTLLDEKTGIKKIFRNVILRYVYKFVDYAFFVGTHNKNYFIKAGMKTDELFFLPYVVDLDRFSGNRAISYNKKAKDIRRKLGINPEDKVIAFIGKFIKKKNPIFALRAIQKYNSQADKKIKLLFIGGGKLENKLKTFARNDQNIFFLPFFNQKDMPVAYRISDIFVLPSKGPQETWGVSVNEAFACERLVIVSDKVGSADDIVKNNDNGEVFISESYDDFIKKLKLLIGREYFHSNLNNNFYKLEEIAFKIESIIKSI